MFTNTMGRGVHFTFPNGYTVSVQWGAMSYCANGSFDIGKIEKEFNTKAGDSIIVSETAEIAIWNKEGKWVTKDVWEMIGNERPEDDVIGHLTVEEVTDMLYFVRNF